MDSFRKPLVGTFCILLLLAAGALADDPVVPGATHLKEKDAGLVLLGELNCVSCHRGGTAPKQAPLLGRVGARVTPQYLRAFLSAPHAVKPGTTMPDLLHGIEGAEKSATVDALVHFLASQGGPADAKEAGASEYQIAQGRLLYHRVGCVACHAPFEPPKIIRTNEDPDPADAAIPKLDRPSVPFGDLAMKTTVDELARFLLDPLKVRPSGRMPSLKLKAGEANMIAAYLLREQLSKDDPGWGVGLDVAYYEGGFNKVPDFDALEPKVRATADTFNLKIVKAKGNFGVRWRGMIEIPRAGRYTFATKSDDGSVLWIDGKKVVDNDGMHPPREKVGSVELTQGRHAFELGFIQGGGGYEFSVSWQGPGMKGRQPIPPGVLFRQAHAMKPKGQVPFALDRAKADRGRALFASLGCASCHSEPKVDSTLKARDLAALKAGAAGGCLGTDVGKGRPDFSLSDGQRALLRAALGGPPAAETKIARSMAALNCFACHARDGAGGPDRGRGRYFVTTVPVDLGEEGTHPPGLDRIGAKLTEEGLDLFLAKGLTTREHMATRMPQFGAANVAELSRTLTETDARGLVKRTPPFSGRLVDDGLLLIGDKGLRCVTCHRWAGRKSLGVPGSDLALVAKRLRPEWFYAWLEKPLALRPGTRMPTMWPGGKSMLPDVQGGDMRRQIDAIWAYLSMGRKAALPAGFSSEDSMAIEPQDRPIVFRTFINGLGAHAIAVGFPQRTHAVFDALHCRTSAAWTGDFVSGKATWAGRAGQYTSIVSASRIDLPPAPTVAALDSRAAPWPKQEGRDTGGWRFEHYRLDDKGLPTFSYRHESGVRVRERIESEYRKDSACLTREIEIEAPGNAKNLFVRLAVGKDIRKEGEAFVVDGRVRLALKSGAAEVRDGAGGRELIVPVRPGKARIEVVLTW